MILLKALNLIHSLLPKLEHYVIFSLKSFIAQLKNVIHSKILVVENLDNKFQVLVGGFSWFWLAWVVVTGYEWLWVVLSGCGWFWMAVQYFGCCDWFRVVLAGFQ